MKIVHCLKCGDLVRLTMRTRKCRCRKSGGRYLKDGLHAEYFGDARVLGMLNHEWRESRWNPPTEPYVQNFRWFVIGHWPGCHITKLDPCETPVESTK